MEAQECGLPRGGPGTLLVAADDTVVATTPAGARWLAELNAAQNGQPGPPTTGRQLPGPIAVAVARSRTGSGAPAAVTAPGPGGRLLHIHAAPIPAVGGQHLVCVTVQPAATGEAVRQVIDTFGLSCREREVLALLLRGHTSTAIASHLFISPHTVRDHIRSIFSKAGVSSRWELAARVFAPYQHAAGLGVGGLDGLEAGEHAVACPVGP